MNSINSIIYADINNIVSFFHSESKPVPITNNAGGSSYKSVTNTAILIVILEALLLRLLNYLLDENPNNKRKRANVMF